MDRLGLSCTSLSLDCPMLARFTHATVRILDWLAGHMLRPDSLPAHQRTGRRGEEDAYFYLRKLGYVMVARNFRSPLRRGKSI